MLSHQLRRLGFVTPLGGRPVDSRPNVSAARKDAAADSHDRRELLRGVLAAALVTLPVWNNYAAAATLPMGRGRFIDLSRQLCAMSIEGGGTQADAIQKALLDKYSDYDFRRLADLLHSAIPQDVDRLVASSGLEELVKSIVSVWYSGLLGTGERTRVLAYEDALAWRATGYAKAPGTCGEFGDWITRPSNALDHERKP
jgi:hypothetical protein